MCIIDSNESEVDTEKPYILLVDDEASDIKIAKAAFDKIGRLYHIEIARNGKEALEILRDENRAKPTLILLDIEMPIMDGKETLKQIKGDETLSKIPTLMLSSALNRENVAKCHNENADAYMPKPRDFQEYCDMARSIDKLWF